MPALAVGLHEATTAHCDSQLLMAANHAHFSSVKGSRRKAGAPKALAAKAAAADPSAEGSRHSSSLGQAVGLF